MFMHTTDWCNKIHKYTNTQNTKQQSRTQTSTIQTTGLKPEVLLRGNNLFGKLVFEFEVLSLSCSLSRLFVSDSDCFTPTFLHRRTQTQTSAAVERFTNVPNWGGGGGVEA